MPFFLDPIVPPANLWYITPLNDADKLMEMKDEAFTVGDLNAGGVLLNARGLIKVVPFQKSTANMLVVKVEVTGGSQNALKQFSPFTLGTLSVAAGPQRLAEVLKLYLNAAVT